MDADDFGALSSFKIGDIVRHKQTPTLRFRVRTILEAVPRKAGNHLYECILVGMRPRTERGRVFNYHESDLLAADGSTEEMDTYTIAEAARLVGTSRGKLYQALRAGHLQGAPDGGPGQGLRVTREALRTAGCPVPGPVAPDPARDTSPDTPREPDTPVSTAEESVTRAPQSTAPERALIAYLERALEQAQARELRLLDLLADLTRQRRAPQAPPAPGAPLPAVVPAAASRPPARPLLSGLRQQIVAVVRQHPEGIAPRDVRTLLAVDHDVRSTMKGMVRSGILTRREAGRYVVAAEGVGP